MSGKVYEKAEPAVQELVGQVLQNYHSEFWDLDIKVIATMVSKIGPEDELVPCLKLHGNPAFAIIHTVKAAQRIHVEHDAEIWIDAFRWNNASERLRKALIDHELEHLVLVKDRQGSIRTDDRGKPKIRLKPDDYALTGFFCIVERHSIHAPEHGSILNVHQRIMEALSSHDARNPIPVPAIDVTTEIPVAAVA